MKNYTLVLISITIQSIAYGAGSSPSVKSPSRTSLNISCYFDDFVTSKHWEVKLGGQGKVQGILEKDRGLYLLDPASYLHLTETCENKLKALKDYGSARLSIKVELRASPRGLFSFSKKKTIPSAQALSQVCPKVPTRPFEKLGHFIKKIATYLGYQFPEELPIAKKVALYKQFQATQVEPSDLTAQLQALHTLDDKAYSKAQIIHNTLKQLILLAADPSKSFVDEFQNFVEKNPEVTELVKLSKDPYFFEEAKQRTQCRTESINELTQLIRVRNLLDSKAGRFMYNRYPAEKKEAQILQARDAIRNEIETFQISAGDVVKSLMSGAGASLPAQFAEFIEYGMAGYFNDLYAKLSFQQKAQFLAEFLSDDKKPNEPPSLPYLLSVFIKYSGPLPQKVLQLLSESDIKSPELEAVLKKTREHITPMSDQEVQDVLSEIFTPKQKETFFPQARFDSTTFKAAATIGQVYIESYKSLIDQKADPSAIKILKKGIKERLKADCDLLVLFFSRIPDSVGNKKSYLQIVNNAHDTMLEETDLRQEYTNLERSHKIYKGEKDTRTLYSVQPKGKFSSRNGAKILVMEQAEGESLAKASEKHLRELKPYQSREYNSLTDKEKTLLNHNLNFWLAKGRALSDLFEVWTKEAIMGGGEFHADLHGGNLFFKFDPELPNRSKLTLIDAGKFGNYSAQERHSFKTLVLSLGILVKFDPAIDQLMSPQLVQNINNVLVSLGKRVENEKDSKWLELADYILDLFVESRKLPQEDRTRIILKNLFGEGMTKFNLPLSKNFQNFNMAMEYPSEGLSQTIREIKRHPAYIAQGSPRLNFSSPSKIIEKLLTDEGRMLYAANALNAISPTLSRVVEDVRIFMGKGPTPHLENSRLNLKPLKERIETYRARRQQN